MKRITLLLAGAALIASLASCNKDNEVNANPNEATPISVMSGIGTKGYVDGTTFYEKATATMHQSTDSTPRTMKLSAYRTPKSGQTFAPGNYFVGAVFESDGGSPEVWRHNPSYYWPIASTLDFLGYSSTDPFAAKDAKWNASNASSEVVLNFDRARCQDDVLFSAQSMNSEDATSAGYVTGQPVNMVFSHAQAWIEFQFSVATEEMKDKIAIKEIILENAFDNGVLTVTRGLDGDNKTVANGSWVTGESSNIIFDDNYGVYGHSKTVDEYTAENANVAAKEQALAEAQASGNADAIAAAEADLQTAKDALALAVAQYPVVNALNAVGPKNTSSTPASGAEIRTDCSFFDMLLPQQPKANIIIRYVLAGRPDVLEYKYTLVKPNSNWIMGSKYIYDIDFVISEITVAPTVKEWVASFDGSDLSPVELI